MRILDTLGRFSFAMLPPGEAISHQQGQAESHHELRQEALEVEDVDHACNGNP